MGSRAEAGLGGGRGKGGEDPWDDRDEPIFDLGDEEEDEAASGEGSRRREEGEGR